MGPGIENIVLGLNIAVVTGSAIISKYVTGTSWPKAIGGSTLAFGTYVAYSNYNRRKDFAARKIQNDADQQLQLQNQLAESTQINATEWQNKLIPVNTAMQACLQEPTIALLTELGKKKNRNTVWRCNKYIDLTQPSNTVSLKFAPSVYSNA